MGEFEERVPNEIVKKLIEMIQVPTENQNKALREIIEFLRKHDSSFLASQQDQVDKITTHLDRIEHEIETIKRRDTQTKWLLGVILVAGGIVLKANGWMF